MQKLLLFVGHRLISLCIKNVNDHSQQQKKQILRQIANTFKMVWF